MMRIILLCYFGVFLVPAASRNPFSPGRLDQCDPDSTCSCTNSRGYIDLHPVANTDRKPYFANVAGPQGDFSYYYNPCYGFNEGGLDCTNAAVCQKDLKTGQIYAIGYANSMISVSDSEYGLIFRYTAQTDNNRTADIILQCDPTKEGELVFQREEPALYYVSKTDLKSTNGIDEMYFNLYSKYACAQKPPTSGPTRPTDRPTEPRPGDHSRPHFRPTPGHHGHHPSPTPGHHGHHPRPTPKPTPSESLKIFGWPAVTFLLLAILVMVTVLCGLIIFGLCLFSTKLNSFKKPDHKAEMGQNINSDYTSNGDKQCLKNDF